MTEDEKAERIKEITDLLNVGVLTSEKLAEAYTKLCFFHCDWVRSSFIKIMEIH